MNETLIKEINTNDEQNKSYADISCARNNPYTTQYIPSQNYCREEQQNVTKYMSMHVEQLFVYCTYSRARAYILFSCGRN